MIKHYVAFMSPGTFVAETTTKEIESWDVQKAIELSKTITERHGAKPYCFYFTTRERKEDEFDSHQILASGNYYLGGKIKTIHELKHENNPKNNILISNMECNKWDKVIETNNSYSWIQPLRIDDIVLDVDEPRMASK